MPDLFYLPAQGMLMSMARSDHFLEIGDARVELIFDSNQDFIGLGAVAIDGVPVRSNRRPIVFRLSTPTGIVYTRLNLREIREEAGGAVLVLRAFGFPWERAELLDWFNQNEILYDDDCQCVEDEVRLTLVPQRLELLGHTFTGFSYQVAFASESREIHRILTHATWELGGVLAGNTVLNRGQCNLPVYRGETDKLFTTACVNNLYQFEGRPHDYSYQLSARGALGQAFDYQYGPQGVLFQYWPAYENIHSLCESRVGSDLLHVIDDYRLTLANEVATLPKHVLFCRGELPEHTCRDLWWEAHRRIEEETRERFGIRPSIVRPQADHAQPTYRVRVPSHDRVEISVHGEFVDSHDLYHALADRYIPFIAAQGYKRFFPITHMSDATECGLKNRYETVQHIHGDLHLASCCGTHRYLPADFFGGMEGWRYLYRAARAHGIELGHWFGSNFTMRAPIFKEHPEWFMRGVNGRFWAGGHGHEVMVVADWSTPIRDWVLDDFRRWREEGGLDYVVTDSWSNNCNNSINYSNRMRTNVKALGEFYAALQRMGFGDLGFEGISSYGTALCGLYDIVLNKDVEQIDGLFGQNNYDWWVGNEDMAFDFNPGIHHDLSRTEPDLRDSAFRIMSARGVPYFYRFNEEGRSLPAWQVAQHHIYNQVVDEMQVRRMLPDRRGIAWSGPDSRIVWAWEDVTLPLAAGETVAEVTPDGPHPAPADGGSAPLKRGCVYRFTGGPS